MDSNPAGPPSLRRLAAWVPSVPGFEKATPTDVHLLDGGASNITCRVGLAGANVPAVVVRLQRERGIFEPYDVIREGRVLSALYSSAIPVPRLLASEPDPAVLGSPFIAMQWVDAPHMGVAGPDASFPAFAAMVAAIHGLDYEKLGFRFLGVPKDARAALRGEVAAIAARRERFAGEDRTLRAAEARLLDAVPGDGRLALCQGDINVFNYLFRKGEVVAVVDWEQARISDPRSDVGQLVALAHLKGMPFGPPASSPFVQLYGNATGAVPAGPEWFRARWAWELAVIYHGWRAFNGTDPWFSREDVYGLLDASLAEL